MEFKVIYAVRETIDDELWVIRVASRISPGSERAGAMPIAIVGTYMTVSVWASFMTGGFFAGFFSGAAGASAGMGAMVLLLRLDEAYSARRSSGGEGSCARCFWGAF